MSDTSGETQEAPAALSLQDWERLNPHRAESEASEACLFLLPPSCLLVTALSQGPLVLMECVESRPYLLLIKLQIQPKNQNVCSTFNL